MSLIDKNELKLWFASLCAACLLVLTILLVQNVDFNKFKSQPAPHPAATLKAVAQAQVVAHQDNMSGAALLVMPSIVCICTTGTSTTKDGFHLEGIGSGVIVNQQGFILTSAQMASGNSDLKVTLYERSHMEGQAFEMGHNHIYDIEIITVSPALQLAVLKIKGGNFPAVRFANTEKVKRSDWCLAVWNELGRKPSISTGMITAMDQARTVRGIKTRHLIEMNCKGKRKYMGGALINKWGEFLGIIIQEDLVVPSKYARAILQSLGIATIE